MSDLSAEGTGREVTGQVIRLVHTHAGGTMAEGTSRGDGSGEILKAQGWRWSRDLGAWYIRYSRDRLAKLWEINAAREGLEAAGFAVEVVIDEGDRRTVAEREAEKAGRAEDRADRLLDRAARLQGTAESADAASRQISDFIPMGQPILVGHHSERRHRRDIDRMHRLDQKSLEASRAAAQAERGAAIAAASTDARNSPVTVGNRIETMEAELRKIGRELTGYTRNLSNGCEEVHGPATGHYAERLRIQQADLQDQVDYWKEVRAKQAADGVPVFSAETISKGDYVYVSGFWRKVVRVSKKSVSCETGYSWTDRVQYHKITRHRTAAEVEAVRQQQAAAGGE